MEEIGAFKPKRLLTLALLTIVAALAGCGSTHTQPRTENGVSGGESVQTAAAKTAQSLAPAVTRPGSFPSGVDATSLASVATAYARAADPWIVSSFDPQAVFWAPKCLAQRGAAARHTWETGVSTIIPTVRKAYAKKHIPQPLPSVPQTADILGAHARRGVPIREVTPADRVAIVFFIDPRTGTQKTAMQPSSTFSFLDGAWYYDPCGLAMP